MEARPVIHPSADALRAFALGKLDDSMASVLMSHLDSCADCCRELAAMTGDDFLARLRQAHSRSGTPAPVKSLADPARAPQPSGRPAAIANLPLELANNPQYEILRELGRGGMGVVYLARHRLSGRLEVLKVMNKELLARPGSRERFLREIQSVARLDHTNVVKMHTALELGALMVLVMEYIEGESLADFVRKQGPLPLANACNYVQQAALGLQDAFERKMVHRDIKPQNLMLAREGKRHIVKVLDFGLVKATRDENQETGLTGEGWMLGTPDYVAPEQTLDAARADIRADIYSLGCTLYYLLAGRPPFSGTSLGAVLLAHQMHEAKPLHLVRPDVPEELAAVVRKMMAKDPAQRYQTPAEVVLALSRFGKSGAPNEATARGKSVIYQGKEVRPATPAPMVRETMIEGNTTIARAVKKSGPRSIRSPSKKKRRKWPLFAIVVVLLAAAGAIGLWNWRQTVDTELQRDWDDSGRVMKTTGFSLLFYKERGPKRVAAWKRAAESNNPMGMYMYGRCLQEGTGVSKDESEAFKWFRKAADLGNARAMNALGVCYLEGTAVTKDAKEALRWYRKAAELHEPTAIVNLGHCSLNGTGMAKSEAEGVQWFREAVNLGDSRAMIGLAQCYKNGTGVAKDEKEAVKWLREAAEVGNAEAMSELGDCYQYGTGVAKDPKEAVEWYRKAADADGLNGTLVLADRMIEGDEFVTRSPYEALKLLNKAKAIDVRGNSKYRIQESLARAALRLAQDDLRALRYDDARTHLTEARAASEELNKERPGRFYFMQDLHRIWFDLGNLERAEGNAKAAADCYRKSMAVDGPEMTKATEALAELLEKGEGVAKDEAKARELRTRFAKQKIKRFTVQCKIGEGGLLFPVHVYVFEVFPWRHPLETQFCYFREERGFDLPKETMDSFERLYKIAKENNVSFTDLCEYALDEKNKKTGSEKK